MIFIGRILTEETKKKRRIVFYNKAIDKAKSEIGKKYNRLTITDIDYEKSYDSYFNKKYHRIFLDMLQLINKEIINVYNGNSKGYFRNCYSYYIK